MKKTLTISILAIAALMAVVSCKKEPNEGPDNPTPDVPTLVTASFTSAANQGVTEDGANFKISIKAEGADGVFTADFISPEGYLPSESYSIGTALNNYSGHFKNDQVDEDVKIGSLTVARGENNAYTIAGDLQLNNGTILKLNINAAIEFEAKEPKFIYTVTPCDYDLTASEKFGKVLHGTIYSIFEPGDPFDTRLADIFIVGPEADGEYTVAMDGTEGAALLGYPGMQYGTFIYNDIEGGVDYVMMGTVVISTKWNQLTVEIKDYLNQTWVAGHNAKFEGCKKVESANEAVAEGFFYKVNTTEASTGFNHEVTVFYGDGKVFLHQIYNIPNETPYKEFDTAENHKIVSADEFASDPSNKATDVYYYIDGNRIDVEPGNYIVVRYLTNEGINVLGGLVCNASMQLPEDFAKAAGGEWGYVAIAL